MADAQATSSAAGGVANTPSLDLDELRDELLIQQTILASLEECHRDNDTPQQIAETRTEIARIQRDINKAEGKIKGRTNPYPRSPLPSAHTEAGPKRSSTSTGAMNSWRQPDTFPGPSSYFNTGNQTPASISTPGASSSGTHLRKRTLGSHFDDDDSVGPRTKSHRTTPSPLQTEITTPSAGDDFFVGDDDAIIDLTGDDDDIERLMEQQRELFAQVEQRKEDERLARNLSLQFQGGTSNPQSSSPRPDASKAFDRILGRPSQSGGHSGPPSQTPGHLADQVNTSFAGNNFPLPAPTQNGYLSNTQGSAVPSVVSGRPRLSMPGSFDGSGLDDFDSFESDDVSSSNLPSINFPSDDLPSTSLPSISTPGYPSTSFSQSGINYAPNLPAAELARRMTLVRQDGFFPGGYGLSPNGTNGHSLNFACSIPSATSSDYRPGTLNSGWYDPLQDHWSANSTAGSSMFPSSRGDQLGDIINQSNRIDWSNGLDAFGQPLSDRLRSYYEDLHDDPRKTEEEIKDLLANIRPDEDIPEEDRIGTPEALRYPLYPHQQLALQWMMTSEDGKNKGGILADDMGLGKTISTLALMVSRPASDRVRTNLIVGPVALIKQWELEIKKKVKAGHGLSVMLLHNKAATYEDLRKFDVVLTSYGKLGFEEKRYQKWFEQHPGADPSQDSNLAKSCPLVHPKSKFYRVILDEAQCIKNVNTLQAKGSCRLNTKYRWCLTGTPMMNGIHELYSLIKFLRIAPYHIQKEFNKTFGSLSPRSGRNNRPSGELGKSKAMTALRVLLKAIMLRRMKTSKLDGKPLLNLPPKTEETGAVEFSEDEQSFYNDLEARSRITFNKYLRAGTVGKNYSNVLVLLLRLRQACCHPHLNLDVDYVGNNEVSEEDMNALAKTLSPDVVDRLKRASEEGFKCPICFDAVIDPTIVLPCGHNTCAECFTTLAERAADANLRAGEDRSTFKCAECRGDIDPKRVINFSTFKAVHMPEPVSDREDEMDTDSDDGEVDSDSSDSDSEDDGEIADDVDRNGNLKDFIVNDEEEEELPDNGDNADGLFVPQSSATQPKDASKKKGKDKGKAKAKDKGKAKAKDKGKDKGNGKGKKKKEEVAPHMLKTLRIEAKKNKAEHKRYMKYLKKNWLPSAKVSECCNILQGIQQSGDKTIVFSQFTFLLDLLEIPIKYELGIKYCRYDGGMSRQQRDAAAQDFQDSNSRTKIMLVSLKAGNAGLNLTAANHVVIMDPFWNPYIEMQAVDRAHRIGQQKPVQVHRLLVKDTVEDRIIALQEQKRKFVDAALDEGESKNLGRLSTRDLQYLFTGVRD